MRHSTRLLWILLLTVLATTLALLFLSAPAEDLGLPWPGPLYVGLSSESRS